MPDTLLILHVKGTEAETAELPKHMVRTAISKGDLTQSQLIWSKADHAWKQAREFPDLLPGHEPAPTALATDMPEPTETANPVPRIAAVQPQAREAPTPIRPQPTPDAPIQPLDQAAEPAPVQAPSSPDYVVKEKDGGDHPLKWVCLGLGLVIFLTLGVNYFLVQQPLATNLRQTSYGSAPVYAHFGAFLQPTVVVIHIFPSAKITADNLTDFLVNLAASTPDSPISRQAFDRVALTSWWTAQYSFSGSSWRQLGEMKDDSKAAREEFLMAQLGDAGGQSLMSGTATDDAARQAELDRAWQTFVANFTPKP